MVLARIFMAAVCSILIAPALALAQVYRWVDEHGVTHLSSERPPPGVKAERIDIATTGKRPPAKSSSAPGGRSGSAQAPASAAQVAERQDLLGRLRTRECVIALEALDRKTDASEPTSASEIRRLQQTVDLNCSPDPVRRRQQEDMAARLRVANSPACIDARNQLADMMDPPSNASREQVRAQQAFVDEHCISPVR